MTKKLYKTALGQTIDMDAVQNLNAEVIAVGNMNVNARGDELGPPRRLPARRSRPARRLIEAPRQLSPRV